jgi:BRCA1-associated protein
MRDYYYLLIYLCRSTASQPPYQPLDILNISQASIQHFPSTIPEQKDLPCEVDYRFGSVRIDWVDFDIESSEGKRMNEMEAKNMRDGTWKHERINVWFHDILIGPVTGTFVEHKRSQSGSIQLPEGSVHLFRDSASKSFATFSHGGALDHADGVFQTSDGAAGVMVAVLAVPSWMTPSDFLAFVAPALDGMTHLRMIRFEVYLPHSPATADEVTSDSAPNRSIVVINFSQATDANEFAEVYNGKAFNSMEVCSFSCNVGCSSCNYPSSA